MEKFTVESIGAQLPEEAISPQFQPLGGEGPAVSPQMPTEETRGEETFTVESTPGQETWGDWALRNVATAGKGVAQRILGLPGDLLQIPRAIKEHVLGGGGYEPLLETVEKRRGPKEAQQMRKMFQALEKPGVGPLFDFLPVSKRVGEMIESGAQSLFGVDPSYFKPKGRIEKILHSSVKDLASHAPLLLLGGPIGLGASALNSIVPNLVKMGVKEAGAGKPAQRLSKLGTQLVMGAYKLFDPRTESRVAYEISEGSVPKYGKMSTPNTIKKLETIENIIEGDVRTPSDLFLGKQLESLEYIAKSKEGKSSVLRLINNKNKISELIRDRKTPAKAVKLLKKLRHGILEDIGAYGKDNKKFGSAFKYAEGLQRDMHKNIKIFKYIDEAIDRKKIGLGTIASYVLGAYSGNPFVALKTLGIGLGVKGGVKVLNALAKGPAMYKYYGKIMALASARKPQQLGIVLRKFDDALTKEYGELNKPVS